MNVLAGAMNSKSGTTETSNLQVSRRTPITCLNMPELFGDRSMQDKDMARKETPQGFQINGAVYRTTARYKGNKKRRVISGREKCPKLLCQSRRRLSNLVVRGGFPLACFLAICSQSLAHTVPYAATLIWKDFKGSRAMVLNGRRASQLGQGIRVIQDKLIWE